MAALGPPVLLSGNGVVQELEFHWVEFAAPACVPLGVDPHPEGAFPFCVAAFVAGPVVAFLAVRDELGEPVVPAGFVLGFPAVCCPIRVPGQGRRCRPGPARRRLLRAAARSASAPWTVPPGRRTARRGTGHWTRPSDDLFDAARSVGEGYGPGAAGGGLVLGLEPGVLPRGGGYGFGCCGPDAQVMRASQDWPPATPR